MEWQHVWGWNRQMVNGWMGLVFYHENKSTIKTGNCWVLVNEQTSKFSKSDNCFHSHLTLIYDDVSPPIQDKEHHRNYTRFHRIEALSLVSSQRLITLHPHHAPPYQRYCSLLTFPGDNSVNWSEQSRCPQGKHHSICWPRPRFGGRGPLAAIGGRVAFNWLHTISACQHWNAASQLTPFHCCHGYSAERFALVFHKENRYVYIFFYTILFF